MNHYDEKTGRNIFFVTPEFKQAHIGKDWGERFERSFQRLNKRKCSSKGCEKRAEYKFVIGTDKITYMCLTHFDECIIDDNRLPVGGILLAWNYEQRCYKRV